jgi:hypothetical protein
VKHPQSLVFWVGRQCLVVCYFLSSALWAEDPEPKPDPAINILVYNMAQAPRAVLTGAEHEAGRILSKAGVRASWFECPAGHSDAESQAICQSGWGPNNIGLRILSKPMAFGNRLRGDSLGFAIHPALASVYYHDKLRFAGDDVGLGLSTILGCFIAHEIGHLLLGSNSHSKRGLMQADWGERQIRQALAGDLLFTSNEVNLVQTEARTRMRLQTASLKKQHMVAGDQSPSALPFMIEVRRCEEQFHACVAQYQPTLWF